MTDKPDIKTLEKWMLKYRILKYRDQIKKEFGIDADKFILEVK
jgi:hypothetical protein